MLELDGIEYSVKTPEENTDDLIAFINDYCAARNIQNSHGEVISLAKNETNPLYMMCYGLSYLTTILQKLVYSAGCSNSVPESSERQLLNIADIAHVKRNAATRTVILGTVYAELPDAAAQDCYITRGLSASVTAGTTNLVFHPAYDIHIPIGESRQIVLIAETYGSYNISENTITSFDTTVPGFRKMVTLASSPGQTQESISSLRQRIQRRAVQGTQMDRAAEAIQSLDGVSLCNIYFNKSPSDTDYIGTRNIPVPPRSALLLVQGYSDDIAKTFLAHMVCPTVGASLPESIGAYVQNYTTHASQLIPVWIVPPAQRAIYIKVYVYETLTYAQIQGIKDAICTISSSLSIGQSISSKMVLDVISESFKDITLQGVTLSADNTNFSFRATPSSDEVFIFTLDNISIIEAV